MEILDYFGLVFFDLSLFTQLFLKLLIREYYILSLNM